MHHHLAVVLPAYNEEASLATFVPELIDHLRPYADRLSVIVVDDASTDATPVRLQDLAAGHPELSVVRNEINRGHGPAALRAYRSGLASGADIVLHVDGDGQFLGEDVAAVVRAVGLADVVHGVRGGRREPWFRRILTAALALLVLLLTGRRGRDVNTPLRAYRAPVLRALLSDVPEEALIPNVHLTIAERRRGVDVAWVRVHSIGRRGGGPTGTMWGDHRRPLLLPPPRLRSFVRGAMGEIARSAVRRRRGIRGTRKMGA